MFHRVKYITDMHGRWSMSEFRESVFSNVTDGLCTESKD